jgi:predicted nucleic acid-binding protein
MLAEFTHVVTDPRRFQKPLTPEEAIAKARFWWSAAEVRQLFPTNESTVLFLDWMQRHQLGRKRILDTQLAATLWTAGVRRIFTSNPADFQIFGLQPLVP